MARKGLPKSYIKKWGITKLAWKKFRAKALSKVKRSTKRKTTKRKTTRKSNPKGGKNRMGKGKSLVTTAVKLQKAIALFVPVVAAATSPGDVSHKVRVYMSYVSGVEVPRQGQAKFKFDRLLVGWGPYIGVSVASKIASKLNGLIRRI